MSDDALLSPRIERLKRDIALGEAEAVSASWADVARDGTPLIESRTADDDHVLVTFLWRGRESSERVLVLGGWHGYHASGNELARVGESDVWSRSYRMRPETRATYHFVENDRASDAEWWFRMRAAQPDPRRTLLLTGRPRHRAFCLHASQSPRGGGRRWRIRELRDYRVSQ